MQRKDIWKFVLICIILFLASFGIWFLYDKDQDSGPIKRNELSNLNEEYFQTRLGNNIIFYVMRGNEFDLTSDSGIKTILPILYLSENPVSEADLKKYIKDNFGLKNYNLESGEYEMVNGMKYTVTKENGSYTAFLGGFGYEGFSYKYKESDVNGNSVIATYELESSLGLPSPGTIIQGKYDVYFKYDNGYLLYDKITYTEYSNPKKVIDLANQYVEDYLAETVKVFAGKTYTSFTDNDIAIDAMRSLTAGGGYDHYLNLKTMEDYAKVKFGNFSFKLDKNRYTDQFGVNYNLTLREETDSYKTYYVSEFEIENKEYFNRFEMKELLNDNTYVVTYKYGKQNSDGTYSDKGITKVYMEFNSNNNDQLRDDFAVTKIVYEEL